MKISRILLLSAVSFAVPLVSYAQVDMLKQPPSKEEMQRITQKPIVKTNTTSDKELTKLNEEMDRYIIVFSDRARIPKGQRNVEKAKSRALRLSQRILRSSKVSDETLRSLEVTTGAVNAAYVTGLSAQQIKGILADRRIANIEKDQYFRTYRDVVDSNPASWGLDRIDQRNLPINNEHNYSDKTTANVYVMDGGVDLSHPEFTGRQGGTVDFTGDTAPSCDNHGTHIAGTIAGATYGIARHATVHDLKIAHCSYPGLIVTSWYLNTINHVVNTNTGLSVINFSSSIDTQPFFSGQIRNAVVAAVTQHNIAFVTSSGNITPQSPSSDVCRFFPNNRPEVLTVAYSTQTDQFGTFAKHGTCVDIAAPGQDIMSAKRFNTTGLMTGTSMAAPHVAGVAASIWMDNPSLTAEQVHQKVKDDATQNVLNSVPAGSPNLLAYYSAPVSGPNQPPVPAMSVNWSHVYEQRPGIEISAAGSSDPDNHMPLSYQWSEVLQGLIVPGMTTDTLNFSSPAVSVVTDHYFNLELKDSLGLPAVGSSGAALVVVPDACTVYDQAKLLNDFPVLTYSANSDFTLNATQAKLETTLTNYYNNALSSNPTITGANLFVSLKDSGTGATPLGATNMQSVDIHNVEKTNSGVSITNSTGTVSKFWDDTPLVVDNWYRLETRLKPTAPNGGMNDICSYGYLYFRLPSVPNGTSNYITNRPIEIYDTATSTLTTGTVGISMKRVTASGNLGQYAEVADLTPSLANKSFCLKAHNDTNYVVSENNAIDVNANRTVCGPWEKHEFIDLNGGDLESGDFVNIKTHKAKYWSAQPSGNLKANRSLAYDWEKFKIVKIGSGTIGAGSQIRLQGAHGKWVVAEGGGGHIMRANRTNAGNWETFTLKTP